MTDIIKHDLIEKTSNLIKNIDLNSLSKEQLEQISKLLIIDKLKTEFKNKIKNLDFNYDSIKEQFFDCLKTDNTKIIYYKAFQIFDRYLIEKDLNVLNFKALEIDTYINYLDSNYKVSNTTKRLYLRCISSFFSILERWEFIGRNYFKGAKLPKKERSRELKVPSSREIKKIFETVENYKIASGRGSYKQNKCAEKYIIILELLIETGLRIGAIKTIIIGQRNIIKGISKSKKFELRISKDLCNRLKKIDLSKINEAAIQRFLERTCKRSKIKIFNPHSFRHYFAVNFYKKTKDMYLLSQKLNHSSISVTENYLKSLKII